MPKNNHGRVRELHPEFFTDEKLMQVSLEANRLFEALWILADREGCLEEPHHLTLKARFFAAWNVDCRPMMDELVTVGLIVRYSGLELGDPDARGDLALLWLPGFRKRQTRLHPREMNTRLWPCPTDPTPFANWRTDKDNSEPVPEVKPGHVLGTAWVLPRHCKGARGLTGSAGPTKYSPLPPSHAKGVQKKKPRGSRHDPNDGIVTHEQQPRTWEPGSMAGHEFLKRLEPLREHMPSIAADLERLTPVVIDGQLVVQTEDAFFADYVRENLLQHLNATGPPVELRLAQPPPL